MTWNLLDNELSKANSVNLASIFDSFDIKIQANINYNCPFHTDNTPSFRYYPDTNTFYCFSCKIGGGPVKFIEQYSNISKNEAIDFLLNGFETDTLQICKKSNNDNRIYLEFSHLIRDFIVKNKDNVCAFDYAEYVCSAFDNIRSRYILDPDGLNTVYLKLKKKLEDYK